MEEPERKTMQPPAASEMQGRGRLTLCQEGRGPNQSRDTGRKNAGRTQGQGCWLEVLLGVQHCTLTHTPPINQGSKARNKGSWQGWTESEPRVVETSNKYLWTLKSVEASRIWRITPLA